MFSSAGLGNIIMGGNDGDGTVNTGQWQKSLCPLTQAGKPIGI
jgi:hypothetical protein